MTPYIARGVVLRVKIMNRILAAFLGMLGWGLICLSHAARAGDLPTTQPDLPRETFEDFYRAVKDGDPAAIPALCWATDAESRKLVTDFQALAGAMGRLHAAVKGKFGAGAVDVVSPQLVSQDGIDAMTETTTGNTAHLLGDNVGPIDLIRIDGRWKLDIGVLLKNGGSGDNPDDFFRQLTQVVTRTAVDISAGKFGTAQDAAEALMVRQSAIGDPVTQATSQP
jgi:hypothetical protein